MTAGRCVACVRVSKSEREGVWTEPLSLPRPALYTWPGEGLTREGEELAEVRGAWRILSMGDGMIREVKGEKKEKMWVEEELEIEAGKEDGE